MSEFPRATTDMIRAAGGLVWRSTPNGLEIAIVHRRRYGGDWTLPKGKLRTGESWESAALREVREETGYAVRVQRFAGAIAYKVDARPKIVCFWQMVLSDKSDVPSDQIDQSEIEEVVWLPVAEAYARLQYPLESALVEGWLADKEAPHGSE